MNKAMERTLATNSLFSAILLSVSGWGLFHAWAIAISAGVFVHALVAIPSMSLCGLLFYRYSLHWPTRTAVSQGEKEGLGISLNRNSIGWSLFLAGVGGAIAWIVTGGSLFILSIAVTGMIIIPWTKISFCRDHFFVSVAMIGIGGAFGLGLSDRPLHSIYYPLCAWMFLIASTFTAMFVIFTHRNQTDRMPASGYWID